MGRGFHKMRLRWLALINVENGRDAVTERFDFFRNFYLSLNVIKLHYILLLRLGERVRNIFELFFESAN